MDTVVDLTEDIGEAETLGLTLLFKDGGDASDAEEEVGGGEQ